MPEPRGDLSLHEKGLPTYRILSMLSDPGADLPSEDVIDYLQDDGKFKAWAIDGASFLTEQPFTTFPDRSDAHWFATELSAFLGRDLRHGDFDIERLGTHLMALRRDYLDRAPGTPVWAHPVAACTIIEMQRQGQRVMVDIHQYADAFVLFGSGVAVQPASASAGFVSAAGDFPWKPFSGFSGERLAELRERRIVQQRNQDTTALTLNAASVNNVVHVRKMLDVPCQVLLGTDGVSRAWEKYRLLEREEVIELVATAGLQALFRRLRHHEGGLDRAGPKARDDAAALHVQCL
ncbi:hypothetical protein [Burkholderia sp. Cy-637]|uniref:hypothetical protein n=1 Tax=Burkholderia sp. Cy-637 TaxID=2608327 RepID=UPI001422EA06|nr:hypothetical protein [Burkholderia sp. Cy-637]NIF92159.1 hypothetical protein [Burkholderia sp. Cy-637]